MLLWNFAILNSLKFQIEPPYLKFRRFEFEIFQFVSKECNSKVGTFKNRNCLIYNSSIRNYSSLTDLNFKPFNLNFKSNKYLNCRYESRHRFRSCPSLPIEVSRDSVDSSASRWHHVRMHFKIYYKPNFQINPTFVVRPQQIKTTILYFLY